MMTESKRYPRLAVLALLLAPPSIGAQEVVTATASATMPSYGVILATSPLAPVGSGVSGWDHLAGTVTVRQNGPWRLEVQHDAEAGSPARVHAGVRTVVEGVSVEVPTGGW